MTDQEINHAIAKACGFTNIRTWVKDSRGISYGFPALLGTFEGGEDIVVPDYCGDLNAMHEAWLTLTKVHEKAGFYCRLKEVVDKDFPSEIANATARQRAEAFLRTIGKWRDTP